MRMLDESSFRNHADAVLLFYFKVALFLGPDQAALQRLERGISMFAKRDFIEHADSVEQALQAFRREHPPDLTT